MQTEIEAKFLNVNHNKLRKKLIELGSICEQPMRLMRRTMFDYPDMRFQKNNHSKRLRVRDEGDKLTVTFKAKNKTNYAQEIETTVGSFETMCQIFDAIGMVGFSYQESKRETWHYKNVEVVLDEWPWLNTYIEIEGPDENAIRNVAIELGFDWQNAAFGSVDTAYMHQYPGMTEAESIGDLAEVRFDQSVPKFLRDRQAK